MQPSHDTLCQIVTHPAQGEEFVTIPNPDYVAATDGHTITVDNPDYVAPTYAPGHHETIPAEYTPGVGPKTIEVPNPDYVPATPETVSSIHHEAVTATQWKFVENGGNGVVWLDYHSNGKVVIDGKTYQGTSHTKTVTVTEAWDEPVTIPGTPAVGEETTTAPNPDYVAPTYTPARDVWVDAVYTPAVGPKTIEQLVDGTPAVGEETIQVANDEFVPAWTEQLCEQSKPTPGNDIVVTPPPLMPPCEATAIFRTDCWLVVPPAGLDDVCAEDASFWECYMLEPGDSPELPAVTPVVTVAAPVTTDYVPELAETGGDALGVATVSLVLVAAGLAAVVASRVRRIVAKR